MVYRQQNLYAILVVLALLGISQSQAQKITQRSGQMIFAAGRLKAAPQDTLVVRRVAGTGRIQIGRAIVNEFAEKATSLWIYSERTGYTIRAGDIVEAEAELESIPDEAPRQWNTLTNEALSGEADDRFYASGVSRHTLRSGLAFGFNAGLMTALSDSAYQGAGPYFLPEGIVTLDISAFRFSITLGRIRRDFEATEEKQDWDQESGQFITVETVTERRIRLYPLLLNIDFMPLRPAYPYGALQPYLGIAAGAAIAYGNVFEASPISLGFKGGVALFLGEYWVIDIEAKYIYIQEGYGFFNLLSGLRFRLPLR